MVNIWLFATAISNAVQALLQALIIKIEASSTLLDAQTLSSALYGLHQMGNFIQLPYLLTLLNAKCPQAIS